MAVKLRGQDPDTIVRWFERRWVGLKDDRSLREEKWEECLWAYACTHDKAWAKAAKNAGRSARYYPGVHDAVEAIVPQIMGIIFNSHDWMTMLPTRRGGGTTTDDDFSEDMRQFLAWQLDMAKYKAPGEDVIRQMAILGNAPFQTSWRIDWAVDYQSYHEAVAEYMSTYRNAVAEFRQEMAEWEQQSQIAAMSGLPPEAMPAMPEAPIPPVEKDMAFNGPEVHCGDIFNYVEEMFPDSDQTTLRAHRMWRSRPFLKRLAQKDQSGYALYENLQSMGNEQLIRNEQDTKLDEIKASILNMQMPQQQKGDELITFTGTFEIGNTTYENHVATIGNRRGLIRLEPLQLWSGQSHIRNARLIKQVGDPYGIGVVEKALGLESMAQAQANQIVDAVAAVIQPEYEVVVDGLYDQMKASGPGARHFVKEKGTINPIMKNMQGIPVGMQQLNSTLQKIEQTTGAAFAMGEGNPRESATKTAGRSNVANSRMTHIARRVELEFIEPSLDQFIQMDAQYLTEEQWYVVTQGSKVKWNKVSPVALRRGWLVRAAGAKMFIDEAQKLERDLMTFQTVSNNPALIAITDMPYLFKKFLRNQGYEDVDRIVNDSEEARLIMTQLALSMAGVDNGGDESGNGDASSNGQAPGGPEGNGGVGTPEGSGGAGEGIEGQEGIALEAGLTGMAIGAGLR